MIKLFVGLGNPGTEYEHTRHNAGFWWIDQMAALLKTPLLPDKNFHGWVARAHYQGNTLWLLKAGDLHEPVGQIRVGFGAVLQNCPRAHAGGSRRARLGAG